MLNVNAITSTLAKMPDAALQKYASLHKDDPYIMALAVSESNRRKQMRGAAQAPQGMPEPPKVADQAVAEMAPQELPENVGIGRLPAGNMNFADGGIIAFGGGEVERYQSAGSTNMYDRWEQLRREGLSENEGQGLTPYGRRFSTAPVQTIQPPSTATLDQRRARAMQQAMTQGSMPEQGYVRTDPRVAEFNIPTIAEQMAGASPAAAEASSAATAAAPATAGARAPAPRANAPRANPPAPAAAPATAPSLDVDALMTAALRKAGETADPQAVARRELGEERVKAKEAQAAGLKAITDQYSDIYKGRKARLDTRESELSKMKDQSTGLALLQAGAAMMSTPGGLARALGKGVQVGSEQYAAGMEKLQSAKEKLADARDRLEEIQAQRGEMSARELFKANNEITDIKLNVREDLIKANMEWSKITREEATKRVDAQLRINLEQFKEGEATKRNTADIAGRLAAARTAAGAPNATLQMAAALGGGTSPEQLETGLRKMKEAETGKTDMRTLYATYLSGAQRNPGVDILSYQQFVGQFEIPVEPRNNPAAPAAPGTQLARPPGT